jgi:hypothetical protein
MTVWLGGVTESVNEGARVTVKVPPVAVPAGVVTATAPVEAPAGTVAVIEVGVTPL